MKNVLIIGGGIIGLCSAYYLQKEGHTVTVVDQSSMDGGASYINAGYLSPSHIIPLAAPGVVKKGLKWMFNPASPLYIKPRIDPDFLKWAWAFQKSCSQKNVNKNIGAIKDIAILGRELYTEIKDQENFSFQLENKGLLMLCNTEKMLEEEIRVAETARNEDLDARAVSLEELKEIEPNVQIQVKGAVHYRCDRHTTPHMFMQEMKSYLETRGVVFLTNQKVNDIQVTNQNIEKVTTTNHTLKADEYVFAAGVWTSQLSKKLGIKLLLQPGKGYSMNSSRDLGISTPAILCESKVAITPMDGFTRFAGTMEIAGINDRIHKVRVEAIAAATHRYYPDIKLTEDEKEEASSGLRPVSPDGLPYIGKSASCKNLTIATGHAMMGWSMGPSTGKLVSEIISDIKTSLPIELYHPDRKF